MCRSNGTAVRLDQEALCQLNRFRRGTHQPLARLVNGIVHDFLNTLRSEPDAGRRTLYSLKRRR